MSCNQALPLFPTCRRRQSKESHFYRLRKSDKHWNRNDRKQQDTSRGPSHSFARGPSHGSRGPSHSSARGPSHSSTRGPSHSSARGSFEFFGQSTRVQQRSIRRVVVNNKQVRRVQLSNARPQRQQNDQPNSTARPQRQQRDRPDVEHRSGSARPDKKKKKAPRLSVKDVTKLLKSATKATAKMAMKGCCSCKQKKKRD